MVFNPIKIVLLVWGKWLWRGSFLRFPSPTIKRDSPLSKANRREVVSEADESVLQRPPFPWASPWLARGCSRSTRRSLDQARRPPLSLRHPRPPPSKATASPPWVSAHDSSELKLGSQRDTYSSTDHLASAKYVPQNITDITLNDARNMFKDFLYHKKHSIETPYTSEL